jgi:hypothetical protein
MMRGALAVGLVLFLALCGSACKKKELRETRYPNGAVQSRGYVQQDADGNYVLVGTWTYWHPNGQKQAPRCLKWTPG